jgi:N utilization substance protein B
MTQRHQAREAALQILYFCDVGRASPVEALDVYFEEHLPEASEATRAFVSRLVRGATDEAAELDEVIGAHSQHWRLNRMATIDRLILRMALWELRHESETPAPVVLDEAIELARTFSTDGSVPFVNGVLDGIRKTLESR